MTVPTIEFVLFSNGLYIRANDFGSNEEFECWKRLRTEIVVWAYRDRSALVITHEPSNGSWARFAAPDNNIPYVEFVYKGTRLLTLIVPTCTKSLLEEVSNEEEFYRSLLWLSYPVGKVENQVRQILRARLEADIDTQHLCKSEFEILTCEGDGRIIVWCKPKRADAEIKEFLEDLCEAFGFSLRELRGKEGRGKLS